MAIVGRAQSIGKATVEIRANTENFLDDLSKVGALAQEAFSDAGSAFRNFVDTAAPGLRKVVQVGAIAVGTGTALATAWTVRGGLSRLMNLENAQARLQSLNVSTGDAKKLMESLTQSVRGTAFALDEAAGVQAMLVSTGIKLDRIPRIFDLIADSAAFANVPLNEVGDIFNKVQSGGKLTGDAIMQLSSRGIPALEILGKGLGKTGEEVRDMTSKGQISSEQFFEAWEKGAEGFGETNIKIAGSAKNMGNTTEGALANMKTSFSRFGATVLEPFFGEAKDVFTGVGSAIDDLGKKVKPFAEQFAKDLKENLPTLTELKEAWEAYDSAIYAVIATMTAYLVVQRAVLTYQAATLLLKALTNPWVAGALAIAAFVGALTYLYFEFPVVKDAVNGVATAIFDFAVAAKDTFLKFKDDFARDFKPVWAEIEILLDEFKIAWRTWAPVLREEWAALWAAMRIAVGVAVAVIRTVWNTGLADVLLIAIIGLGAIASGFVGFVNLIGGLMDVLRLLLSGKATEAWGRMGQVVSEYQDGMVRQQERFGRATAIASGNAWFGATEAMKVEQNIQEHALDQSMRRQQEAATEGGNRITNGFINGLKENLAAVRNTFQLWRDAYDGVMKGFKFGSPSRLTAQHGKWIVDGFTQGIERELGSVDSLMDRLSGAASNAFGDLQVAAANVHHDHFHLAVTSQESVGSIEEEFARMRRTAEPLRRR